jgi:hypothetical protein
MDRALILADQILTVIRDAGISRLEAHAALMAADSVLGCAEDISLMADQPEQFHDAPERP